MTKRTRRRSDPPPPAAYRGWVERRRPARRGGASEVYGITTARRGQHDDVHARMVKYAVSMGIRMVCLVLAFVVHGWLAWVFVAGAVLLPYVAVLLANEIGRAHV